MNMIEAVTSVFSKYVTFARARAPVPNFGGGGSLIL